MKKMQLIVLTMLALLLARPTMAGGPQDPVIEGRAILRLHPGFDVASFNATHGSQTVRSIPSRNIYLVESPEGLDVESWVVNVLGMQPNGVRWLEAEYDGQDGEGRTGSFYVSSLDARSRFPNQWSWNRVGLAGAQAVTLGEGVRVAVIDTGVDVKHPFLQGKIAPGGYNFVDQNNNVQDVGDGQDNDADGETDESVGHGTFVAGLIGFMAPQARILPIRAIDSDGHIPGFTMAEAVFHAIDQDVDIINMSLGTTYDSFILNDALIEASIKGIVVVGAGGNQNQPILEHPSALDDGIGVAALDQENRKASFSSYYDEIGLSAPGVEVYSTIPRDQDGNTYAKWEGTSFSTAFVSGAAALVMAANKSLPVGPLRSRYVISALRETAVNIDGQNQNFLDQLGAGLLDAASAVNASDPTYLFPVDVNVQFGQLVRGGLNSIWAAKDGDLLEVQSQFGFSAQEPNIIDVRVGWQSNNVPTLAELQVTSWMNTSGGVGRVSIRDWTQKRFENIGQFAVPQPPAVPADPPNSYRLKWEDVSLAGRVRASDGRIEVRVTHVVIASFSAMGFRSSFDGIELEVD